MARLHEYQGKEILAANEFKIPSARGRRRGKTSLLFCMSTSSSTATIFGEHHLPMPQRPCMIL
jgi:hypothetical protein